MSNSARPWLNAVPWESVVTLNRALCHAQKVEPLNNAKGFDAAQRLWMASQPKNISLRAVVEICHEACELKPFTFNNGNTFAAVARTLIDEHFKHIPPVEAQILRTTVCHYIVDQIGAKELQQVLRHFEPKMLAGGAGTESRGATTTGPSGARAGA